MKLKEKIWDWKVFYQMKLYNFWQRLKTNTTKFFKTIINPLTIFIIAIEFFIFFVLDINPIILALALILFIFGYTKYKEDKEEIKSGKHIAWLRNKRGYNLYKKSKEETK